MSSTKTSVQDNYKVMWEDIGTDSGESYLDIKFRPTYRIGLTHHLRENKIYDFLSPQSTDIVLDIACASGRQLFGIYRQIKKGYGVDISDSFLNKARRHQHHLEANNLEFKQGVIENIPFADVFFDKIICAEVLEHVFDKDQALKEVLRVLKPGGFLIISVPYLNADATLWGRFLRRLGLRKFTPLEDFSQKSLFKHGDSHVREFNIKTMRDWLEKNGLQVEIIRTVSFIDGPYFDTLLKIPLHIPPLRWLTIKFEKLLSWLNLPFGRHMIVRARKLT
jgi:ubiquinone/menaquinone biosynthesis C-methylase UbiE